jgi:bifunctional pyridoxal-dependent enzyme with beta-cystathionase and maltose regulon repressor activities
MSSHDFVRYLLREARVKVRYSGGLWGNGSEGYVSVNFSCVDDAQITEALSRIELALNQLQTNRSATETPTKR